VAEELVEAAFFLDRLEPMEFAVDETEQRKQNGKEELWS